MPRNIRIIRSWTSTAHPKPIKLKYVLTKRVEKRFWGKVDDSAGPDSCWPFCGAKNTEGYGLFRVTMSGRQSRLLKSHVVALMLTTKQRNTKLGLHSQVCTMKACCNPKHLRWGNRSQNGMDRRDLKGTPTQKLTWDDVDIIRDMLVAGYPKAEIGILFDISLTQVRRIESGARWNPATRNQAA